MSVAFLFAKGCVCVNIKMLKLTDIIPYEKNPRRNDEAVKYVAESIKSFGFKNPIVLDKDNIIVAGHTRYKAAKKLNLKEVPCIVADDLTDEQIKAFRLADNKVAEKADWDFDLLGEELDSLLDFDMTVFGFEDEDEDEPEEEIDRKEQKIEVGTLQLIIDCDSEEDMQEKYEKIAEVGIECRVSTL